MSTGNWKKIRESLSIPDLCRRMNLPLEIKNKKVLCPIHQEKSPSFHLYDDGRKCKCYGCGAGGDVGDFYCALTKCDMKQAYKDLCEMLNLTPDEGFGTLWEKPKAIRVSQGVLKKVPEPPRPARFTIEIERWLKKKGISEAVYFELLNDGDLTVECGKLVFIYNSGRKERGDWDSSRGNRWIEGGADGGLWRIQEVRNFDNHTILMCEGESDAMRVLSNIRGRDAGFGVVAIPAASWVPDEAMATLIGRNRNVVLMYDNDKAGDIATHNSHNAFRQVHGCKVYNVNWHDGYKDVCDMPQEVLQKELDKVLTLA